MAGEYSVQVGPVQFWLADRLTAEDTMRGDTMPAAWSKLFARGEGSIRGGARVNFTDQAREIPNASIPQASGRHLVGQAGYIDVTVDEITIETMAMAAGFLAITQETPTSSLAGTRRLNLTKELGRVKTKALALRWAATPYYDEVPKGTGTDIVYVGKQIYCPEVATTGDIIYTVGPEGEPTPTIRFVPYRQDSSKLWVTVIERYAPST